MNVQSSAKLQHPEPLTSEAATAHIQQFEADHDLLQYEVDGWCAWPLVRGRANRLLQHMPAHRKPIVHTNVWSNRARLLHETLRVATRLIAPRNIRYAVLSYPTNLRNRVGTLYEDVYFDQLLMEVGNYVKIEGIGNEAFVDKSSRALVKSDLSLKAFAGYANILARRFPVPLSVPLIAQHFRQLLVSELALDTLTSEQMVHALAEFFWSKQLYAMLLKRLTPTYLLLTDAYHQYPMVAAAQEQGITVIEFQHGALYNHHFGYSWSSYATTYKAKLPTPDRLFLYGDYWKQQLERSGFWDKELRSVGSLRVDSYRTRRLAHTRSEHYTLLFTTQGHVAERVITFFTEFFALACGHLDCSLVIKMHPMGDIDVEQYQLAFQHHSQIRLIHSYEDPSTFDLLMQAHLHISVASTCHYEALALGIPTVILPLFSHYQKVLHLCESGFAFLAETPGDLLALILQHRLLAVPDSVGDVYFKAHALDTMKKELGL